MLLLLVGMGEKGSFQGVSSGFNTDVQVGHQVFHVQTEDRGPAFFLIDTAVYQKGMVLHRHSSDYEQFAQSAEFSPEALHHRVEQQHRAVIGDLRSGALDKEIGEGIETAKRASGIQVRLLNPKSWLSGGKVSLDLEILRRADRRPEKGAHVAAAIEGAEQDAIHKGMSDGQGRSHIEFPLPVLGKGDLTLVIQALTDSGKDEIRFAMRARPKAPAGRTQ
jgi:hypothetical protein